MLDTDPRDAAPRFDQRTDHPMTQAALLAELKANHATEWPRIWGTLWGHREACMVAALRALDAALADPKVTREGLRRRMVTAFGSCLVESVCRPW